MHSALKSQLNRRALLIGAAAAATEFTSRTSWAANDSVPLNFYASRSGRFGRTQDSLLIGGILIPASTASQLEPQLKTLSEEVNFKIPLEFSTNFHNIRYYRRALSQFMALPDSLFAGVRIRTPNWPQDRAVWQSWRTEIEEKVFKELSKKSNLSVVSLKHDYDADIQIYKEISESLPLPATFDLLKSHRHSTRLMELSGFICKSLRKPEILATTPGNAKDESCRHTYSSFGIKEIETDIFTAKLILRNISV